jgi:hypothetical protein
MKVEDVKIQNVVRISYIYVNGEDSPVPMNISQGKVVWKQVNLTVQSASIIDNLGERFTPLNYSNYFMNPQLGGAIAPHSMYNLSLFIVLMPGALYVDSYEAWEFGTTLASALPTEASIILPINFSVPFSTTGSEQFREDRKSVV